eukprot:GHVN01085379.1.p1 GENE.GHVN01085379.1~~GHVN01085379.1.p1  ORF type:complete len:567 (+),score=89.44 GHVN01085379.1:154-1854(+)
MLSAKIIVLALVGYLFSGAAADDPAVDAAQYGHQSHKRGGNKPHAGGGPYPSPQTGYEKPKDYEKQKTYHAACCLPHFPANDYGHPQPLFDQLLFSECPDKKTPEVICEAAADLLVTPPSTLHASAHKSEKANKLKFLYDKTQSPFATNLAVVSNGCCFNIYSDVKPGQTLNAKCLNTVLGDNLTLIKSITKAQVYVAGAVDMKGQYGGPVYVGGDYLSSLGATIAQNTFGGVIPGAGLVIGGSVTKDGEDIKVVQGGAYVGVLSTQDDRIKNASVNQLPDPGMLVKKISAQVCALSQQINHLEKNSFLIVTAIILERRLLSSQVDKASEVSGRQLRQGQTESCVDSTCTVGISEMSHVEAHPRRLVTANEAPSQWTLNCESGVDPCVFSATTDELNNAGEIIFQGSPGVTFKINIRGRFVKTTELNQSTSLIQLRSDINVIWNFPEANQIFLAFENATQFDNQTLSAVWPGSILAPQAVVLEITGSGVQGTVATGNPNSMVIIRSGELADMPRLTLLSSTPNCPPPVPKVTFCHCLCPETYAQHTTESTPIPPIRSVIQVKRETE